MRSLLRSAMRISTTTAALFACGLLLAPRLSAGAPAAQDASRELSELLSRTIEGARDAAPEDLWRRADALRDAARELGAEGLDAEIDRALGRSDLSEGATLLLSGMRLQGPDVEPSSLAEGLRPLFDSRRDDLAVAALGLAADPAFRTLPQNERRALVEALLARASDGARAPQVRLEAAYAASKIGGGDDIRRTRALMREFLDSSDADLRAMGALTLARAGAEVTGTLYDELRRLASLPGERGKLAASYLEKERVRELGERKLQNFIELSETAKAGEPSTNLAEDEIALIGSLIAMIERQHLEGDEVKRDELIAAAMQGMLQSLDEHSAYLSSKAFTRFEQDLAAGYGGIGAYVGEDREDGLFTITHPIYSGPAYRAGLRSEDKIVKIDDWPTIGEPVDDIIKRLKGRPGTTVKLYVWRRGMDPNLVDRPSEDIAVTVTREAITIPTEQHQMLPGKIGMLVLRDFSQVASAELRKPILEMLDAGMQGLIFDLRYNSGGLLEEAVNVASLFLPRGTLVVSTESRTRPTEKLFTEADPLLPPSMPMVVLVNRFTASAAEIVSGALQDHARATVIGQRTFGKGSVQNLMTIRGTYDDRFEDENKNGRWDNWERITKDYDGDGEFDFAPRVKLTIARYLLPTGRSIHREVDKEGNVTSPGGIQPDLVADATRIDRWRVEEMERVRASYAPRDYVDRHWAEYKQRFSEIADNDQRDTSRYPVFDEFYRSLHTPLPPDDVRQLLRFEIRRRVQDERGQEFPQGDFVEDVQLQAAIREILARLGKTQDDYEAYRTTIPPQAVPQLDLAAVGESEMRATLEQLEGALKARDHTLPESTLRELVELLKSSLDD